MLTLSPCVGFVANPRRFNVAMTRAQALLIIVGDPVVLSLDRMWRQFLDYIHANGGWKGKPRDWDDSTNAGTDDDWLGMRRNDARDAIDDLARRLRETVIDEVQDSDEEREGRDADVDAQDRPWREADA